MISIEEKVLVRSFFDISGVSWSLRPCAPQKKPLATLTKKTTKEELLLKVRSIDELKALWKKEHGLSIARFAKNFCFSDGVQSAKIMLIGEAPGKDEDIQGLPFVGQAGKLLDKILKSVGLDRKKNVYITNILPFRPPGNRTPSLEEQALCMPFVHRHINLVAPKVIVAVGGICAKCLISSSPYTGILKMRGRFFHYNLGNTDNIDAVDTKINDVKNIEILPTLHPAYLLRQPRQKKLSYLDFTLLRERYV